LARQKFATMSASFANLPIKLFPDPEMVLELIPNRPVCCGKLRFDVPSGTTNAKRINFDHIGRNGRDAHPRFQGGKHMNDDLLTWPWDEWNDIGGEG
jgi:hypothetical protein